MVQSYTLVPTVYLGHHDYIIYLVVTERDGVLVFEDASIDALETGDDAMLCVMVSGISGTVGTAFDVNVGLMDGTAGKCA